MSLPETLVHQEDLEAKLVDVQATYDKLSKEISSNQLEIGSIEQRYKEAERAAHESSNSKEVSQYQNQAHQFRTRIEELEEDTLPLMEDQEELSLEIKNFKDELTALAPKVQDLMSAEEIRVKTLNNKIETFSVERDI